MIKIVFVAKCELKLYDCCTYYDVSAVQDHPRSLDFGTNRKRVCDFRLVRHSNLGPIVMNSTSPNFDTVN